MTTHEQDDTGARDALEALRECRQAMRHLQRMESIGAIGAGIGHEFNNLMQTVMSALLLMRKSVDAGRLAETDRFIATALNAARSAAAINQRLVRFSSRRPEDARSLTLNEVASGMEDLLRAGLSKSIVLTLDLASDPWTTRCDHHQAEHALLDLVLDARDALPGAGRIVVRTRNANVDDRAGAASKESVRLEVSASPTATSAGDARTIASSSPSAAGVPTRRARLAMVEAFAAQHGGGVAVDEHGGGVRSTVLHLPRDG